MGLDESEGWCTEREKKWEKVTRWVIIGWLSETNVNYKNSKSRCSPEWGFFHPVPPLSSGALSPLSFTCDSKQGREREWRSQRVSRARPSSGKHHFCPLSVAQNFPLAHCTARRDWGRAGRETYYSRVLRKKTYCLCLVWTLSSPSLLCGLFQD